MNSECMPLRVGFNFVLVKFCNGEGNSKAKKKNLNKKKNSTQLLNLEV